MAKRRVCYELYVHGRLAVRGDIGMVADALCVAPETARRIQYKGHGIAGCELVALPVLYDWHGESLPLKEIAERARVKEATVVAAACRNQGVGGHMVRKHQYDEFTVGFETVERWRQEGKDGR